MLRRNITYKDFNGEEVTETFYFNISKRELTKLQFGTAGGYAEELQRIVKMEDQNGIITQFDNLILTAYGVKSEDGKEFTKTPELRAKFENSAAYDALFEELSNDDKAFMAFIQGVFPADVGATLSDNVPLQRPPVSFPNTQVAVIPPPPQSS